MRKTLSNKIVLLLICLVCAASALFLPTQHADACQVISTLESLPAALGTCTVEADVSPACRGGGECDAHDKTVINIIVAQCTGISGTVACNAADQARADAAKALISKNSKAGPAALTCAGWTTDALEPECWFRYGATWIAALIISISVTILGWAGSLFNIAISQTVLGFDGWITGTVLDAIGIGWTFFRDIANIIIIGLFVYIAIGIILGINSPDKKRLIARVLIIAILINFSFLFTRIIINFSNALAIQFAKPLVTLVGGAAGAGTPPNIAGKFAELMDIKSLSETQDALLKIAANQNNIYIALGHALAVLIIVICAALVLLYGAFLLLGRALILILLMVTSSFAFATYLHPTFAKAEYGWSKWWSALIRNAMLAPAMMLLLFIVLKISSALVDALNQTSAGTKGVLGALASNPTDPKNISALLTYFVILGLLYGAIKISNNFAETAGRFAQAGTAPWANLLKGAGLNVTGATIRGVGFLGRNTIGREAAAYAERFTNKAKGAPNGSWKEFSYAKLAQAATGITKRQFNPGDLMSKSFKQAQTPKDKGGGGAGQEERRLKERDERAKITTPETDAVKEQYKKALDKARSETTEDKTILANSRKTAEDNAKAARDGAKAMEDVQKTIKDEREKLKGELTTMKADPAHDPAAIAAKEREVGEKDAAFKAQARKIEDAEKQATEHAGKASEFAQLIEKKNQQRADELSGPVGKRYSDILQRNEKGEVLQDQHGNLLEKSQRQFQNAQVVTMANQEVTNALNRLTGIAQENNTYVQGVRKALEKKQGAEDKTFREGVGKLLKEVKEGNDKTLKAETETTAAIKNMGEEKDS